MCASERKRERKREREKERERGERERERENCVLVFTRKSNLHQKALTGEDLSH